jgi:hypothetical protein
MPLSARLEVLAWAPRKLSVEALILRQLLLK